MLLRLAAFSSSSPYTKVSSHRYDQKNDFDDAQSVGRDERVGQRCPWHEEEPYERRDDASEGCRDAIAKQPHEDKRNTGCKTEGYDDPTAHNPTIRGAGSED